jgi:hypothetical protein
MLVADGVTRDGRTVEIRRSFWERERVRLDLINGDLLEFLPDARDLDEAYSRPTYRGLMFRKRGPPLTESVPLTPSASTSATFHVNHTASDRALPATTDPTVKKSIARVETSAAARKACRDWLLGVMRENPNDRTSIKVLWKEAQERWAGTLSKRSFLDARTEAIRISGATAWAAAGATKKARRK